MRNPILMFRTALIATIGFFVVCSISHADPRVDAFVQGFNKGKKGNQGGQNDPAQQFQQILQQLSEAAVCPHRVCFTLMSRH